MYVPLPYQEHRQEVLLDAIRARSFGTLLSAGDRGIEISHLPFAVADRDGPVLLAHLARSNAQWRAIEAGAEVVASFLVDDAYISPGWYPTKAETGKVVPTWNYVAVEARGVAELIHSGPELAELIDVLTDRHERSRVKPWSMQDAPADFTDAMLKAIVGVRLRVERLTGAWKLDQKKRPVDRDGAANGLIDEHGMNMMAQRMRSAA